MVCDTIQLVNSNWYLSHSLINSIIFITILPHQLEAYVSGYGYNLTVLTQLLNFQENILIVILTKREKKDNEINDD